MHVHCAVVGAPREHAVRDGGVGRAGPRSQPELQVRMAEIMLEAFKDEDGKTRLATHKDQCVCALIRYFRVTVALSRAAPNRRFAIGQQRAGQTSVSRIEAVGGSIEPGFFLTVALAFGSAERALRCCHTSTIRSGPVQVRRFRQPLPALAERTPRQNPRTPLRRR